MTISDNDSTPSEEPGPSTVAQPSTHTSMQMLLLPGAERTQRQRAVSYQPPEATHLSQAASVGDFRRGMSAG